MTLNVQSILLVIAAILFLIAAIGIPSRINLGWLGAFFLTLWFLLGKI